ncbi:MAG TPA: right-handed parallel beta-helix repeat-containing protein [Desulfomonilia bacterium]
MKRFTFLVPAMILFIAVISLSGCTLPIVAINNAMLALAADSGSGTESNPYIIENKTFDMAGKNVNAGIHLRNTTAYLEIRNITVKNGIEALGQKDNLSSANCLGILLENVSHVTIKDCHFENNNMGMWLEGCFNVSAINNTVLNNRYRGIYLMDSNNCRIEGNTVNSDNAEYDNNILLNINTQKPASVCKFNKVWNNETKEVTLSGNENTAYNDITGNSWGGVPAAVHVGTNVGPNYIY